MQRIYRLPTTAIISDDVADSKTISFLAEYRFSFCAALRECIHGGALRIQDNLLVLYAYDDGEMAPFLKRLDDEIPHDKMPFEILRVDMLMTVRLNYYSRHEKLHEELEASK